MKTKGVWATAMTAVVAIAFVLMAGQAAAAPGVSATHASLQKAPTAAGPSAWMGGMAMPSIAPKTTVMSLCAMGVYGPGGIYPISKKAAYVENWSTGDIAACGSGIATTIATPPSGYSAEGYYGIAGAKDSGKLDLILLSFEVPGGYYCLGASSSGCASTAAFVLPSTFCSSEPYGFCNPDGVVLSKNLAFTYVDVVNQQMVSCTAYATSCAVDAASSAFSGYKPVNIAQLGSKLAVSDNSCSGLVWEGSTTSMKVVASIGDSLQGIAFHSKVLYVADDGICTDTAAHIINLKTGASLPTPLTAPDQIVGLDSDLQFGSWDTGEVFSV